MNTTSAVKSIKRQSGVLLPITSLPSRFGIGDLGPEALKFARFLHDAGQAIWQVLPLTATNPGCGNSPYSPTSAFAGSELLISPEVLVSDGLLDASDLDCNLNCARQDHVNYDAVAAFKKPLLRKAWERFKTSANTDEFQVFRDSEHEWLEDYALFTTIKNEMGGRSWPEWPDGLRTRDAKELAAFKVAHADEVAYQEFIQYIFSCQMANLRKEMAELGVEMVGDMPLYVTQDCADVWSHPELFDLDKDLKQRTLAGVPPDYFSQYGQLWGNPTYDWKAMEADNFHWWMARLRHLLTFFDRVRIDHFRGLVAYWAVPFGETTAVNGKWQDVPCEKFFGQLAKEFPTMPFWAENLGIITPDVEEMRNKFALPGMLILHFAFGNPADNPYAPHNNHRNNVIYTGTHDNNTSIGWFTQDASEYERKNLEAYLGHSITASTVASELTRMALASVANTAIIPMQDWLELGTDARINVPSLPSGNWAWRMLPNAATSELAERMSRISALYGRMAPVATSTPRDNA